MSLTWTTAGGAVAMDLTNQTDKINYSVGHQIGGDFKRQGVAINADALLKGIQDALSDSEPLIDKAEMTTTLIELKRRITLAEQARAKNIRAARRAQDQAFLDENAKKAGVTTRPSGLQYKVLTPGSGTSPTLDDSVTVHYRGTLVDGSEFDSSQRNHQPATFPVRGVIAGWTEALQLMQEGAKWQLVVPHHLAYAERGPLAERALIFEVELLSINK
jgi:FKBP-type peptidyl-prolyl cis-trans isomerase FklB